MRALTLERLTEGPDAPTYGRIIDESGDVIVPATLELPWRDNQHNLSRIPAGQYAIFRFESPHLGYTLFQFQNVPGRSGVDIHVGNTMKDTDGCVLVGMARGWLNNEPAIMASKIAFDQFMAALVGVNTIPFTVVDVPPVIA